MFVRREYHGIYYLHYGKNPRRKVTTHTKNKSEAIRFLREFREEQKPKPLVIPLSQFKTKYLEYSKSIHSVKTQEHHGFALKRLISVVGDIPLAELTLLQIHTFLAKITEDASKWSAAKYYGALRSSFQTALEWEYIQVNPWAKVKKPKLPQIIPLALKKEEAESLINAIRDIAFKNLTVFTLETGLRLGEAISLEWIDILEGGRAILVQNKEDFTTKSGRCRTIPLSPTASSTLASLRGSTGLIFRTSSGLPWRHNNVEHKFKVAVRDAKLDDRIHFHTLRHTFATWFLKRGGNIYL